MGTWPGDFLTIGIAGQNGCGKTTVISILETRLIASGLTVQVFSSSALLIPIIERKGWPKDRLHFNLAVLEGDQKYGSQTWLPDQMKSRMLDSSAKVRIWDGIRRFVDVDAIQSSTRHRLGYVAASATVRLARVQTRNQKDGEAHTTSERFAAEDNYETNRDIPKIAERCSLHVDNSETDPTLLHVKNRMDFWVRQMKEQGLLA